ncbi:MAG TPA: gluconate 2-dehydrogenase subunit 3 family protein [Bryobacteraceae bacterium]|nr:gluconate 2-dehydrogenase subunit 3 family protein [Bryobacteraceae bacterium]
MKGSRNLPRRRFVQTAIAGATAATAASCGRSDPGPWRVLTAAEARTLAAVCDQIIPPDDFPGASAAGVLEYIDRQLAGRFKRHRSVYADGIRALDELGFTRLPSHKQFELLTQIEAGKAGDARAREFFALAIGHTMQGYYGMARHGGNRDYVSWRMLGVPVRPVRGRES